MSLISTVSSVGEDDNYLSEPTYNNLDPVWAQRHGFGPGKDCHVPALDATLSLTSSLFLENSVDIDAFSEEFDIRMKFGRGPSSTCSIIPRPTFTAHPQPPAGGHCYPGRPGSAATAGRDQVDGRTLDGSSSRNDPMIQSQISHTSHTSENTSGRNISGPMLASLISKLFQAPPSRSLPAFTPLSLAGR